MHGQRALRRAVVLGRVVLVAEYKKFTHFLGALLPRAFLCAGR